jgi:CotS family spore coat protein
MRMRTKAAKAARSFGLKPTRIIRVKKGVYRVVLCGGKSYSLKRMPVSLKNLRWMDRSLRTLRKKGFKRIAWRRVQSKHGRKLFVRMSRGGRPYVLVPWISGRWPSVKSTGDMRACGVLLARFHKAGQRVRLRGPGAVNKVGKWPSQFRHIHGMMFRLVKNASIKQTNLRPMDRLLSAHGQEILMYSRKAQRLLKRRGYKRICRSRPFVSLCHGDGGPSNFIRNAKGMHLIDFETLRVDLRAYDLYRVIYNASKDHGWRFSIAKQILDGYQSVTKLKRQDFAMLRTLLRFPRTSYLLLNRYRLSGNRGKTLAEKKFLRALAAERGMSGFMMKLDRYARR